MDNAHRNPAQRIAQIKNLKFYLLYLVTSALICFSILALYFTGSAARLPVDLICTAVSIYLLCGGSTDSARPALLVLPFAYLGQVFLLVRFAATEAGMALGATSGAAWVIATVGMLLVPNSLLE